MTKETTPHSVMMGDVRGIRPVQICRTRGAGPIFHEGAELGGMDKKSHGIFIMPQQTERNHRKNNGNYTEHSIEQDGTPFLGREES